MGGEVNIFIRIFIPGNYHNYKSFNPFSASLLPPFPAAPLSLSLNDRVGYLEFRLSRTVLPGPQEFEITGFYCMCLLFG